MTAAAIEDVPFLSRDAIEQRAAAIRRSHGLETIPVDPVILANREGIAIHNAKFAEDSIVGMIAKRGDTVTLLVNQSAPPYRKRFTAAHELGHHFLHLLGDGDFVDREADLFRQSLEDGGAATAERRREIQANLFAAALLMPEEVVRSEWTRLRSVETMARRFNVSVSAMGLRVGQLGLD